MIGGTVSDIKIEGQAVVCLVVDEYRTSQIRSLQLTPVSRCIGTGDSLWWQSGWYYWTPQGSARSKAGKDFDVKIRRYDQ